MRRLTDQDWKRALATVVACATLAPATGFGRAAPPVILEIDLENYVDYCSDVADYSKLATDPTPTTSMTRTFGTGVIVADIGSHTAEPEDHGTFSEISRQDTRSVFKIAQPIELTPIGCFVASQFERGTPVLRPRWI